LNKRHGVNQLDSLNTNAVEVGIGPIANGFKDWYENRPALSQARATEQARAA